MAKTKIQVTAKLNLQQLHSIQLNERLRSAHTPARLTKPHLPQAFIAAVLNAADVIIIYLYFLLFIVVVR